MNNERRHVTRSIARDKWQVDSCCSGAAVVGKSVAGIDDPKTIATPTHGVVADLFV